MSAFDPRTLKGRQAGILGLGVSGLACARLLARKGFRVFGSDSRPRAAVRASLARWPAGVAWEGGGHGERLLKCDFVVKSPGIPRSSPILKALHDRGIPLFSEVEVALAFCKAREIVAVTGTNGKTTTTELLGRIFSAAAKRRGGRVHIGGNIGIPLSDIASRAARGDTLILEVSSYQLEDSRHFRPTAACILNITADHLDHHGGMQAYIDAKARIFREQKPENICVFNADDPLTLKLSRRCPAKRLFFGSRPGGNQAWKDGAAIRVRLAGTEARLEPPPLPGDHNRDNAMAAALLALSLGVRPPELQRALKTFRGVEHRLEDIGRWRGMRCINDSKATNVDSTLVALRALAGARGVMLILGGLHKGSPYTPLRAMFPGRVKCVLTIGSAAGRIEQDLGGSTHIFPCGDLETAVRTALQVGEKGDTLLLSPSCASFDQFRNFEHRGEAFKSLVTRLGRRSE